MARPSAKSTSVASRPPCAAPERLRWWDSMRSPRTSPSARTGPTCARNGPGSGTGSKGMARAYPRRASGTRALLLRVVERERHDGRRDPLLVAVELADLDLRADLGVLRRHPAQGDVLAQRRAARSRRDDADLRAPARLVDAVAVAGGLVAGELEAHEPALRVLAALDQRLLADEVLRRVEREGEADAGLERVDLVVELVAGEDQPRLDAEHVERVEAERHEPVRRARLHDRVPHGRPVARRSPPLVPRRAAVAGRADDDRDAVVAADPPDEEAEPLELLELRLGRRRPDDLLEDVAAARPLDGHVVQLVGRRLDEDALQPEPLGERLEVDAVVRVAADEAEVVVGDAEDRRVVDHAAG